jgi:hypothetical protein
MVDATINLRLVPWWRYWRWWRDEPSGNEVRETFCYVNEVYLPWLPLLSGLVLPTPSRLRLGLALGGRLPISRAIGFVGVELPTLVWLGVWALAMWANLALFGLSRNRRL